MTTTTAILATANASRYLQQLCKHFGRKVPADFTPTTGRVSFPFGDCDLTATEQELTLRATAEDAMLDRLERVLGDHLARFAFREAPTLVWRRSA